MKTPLKKFFLQNQKFKVSKKLLFTLAIIFIVSPGWLLGLYWMRFEKLPWEKKDNQQQESDITTESIKTNSKDDLTDEEKINFLIKNDIFEPFPLDITEETIANNVLLEDQIKSYTFHETYMVIEGKQYTFTNHTEMLQKGKSLDINKGVELLNKGRSINALVYTKEGLYVETIIFN